MVRTCDIKLHNRAAVSAPINSSVGRVSGLRGATLDFAIIKEVLLPLHMKATAP